MCRTYFVNQIEFSSFQLVDLQRPRRFGMLSQKHESCRARNPPRFKRRERQRLFQMLNDLRCTRCLHLFFFFPILEFFFLEIQKKNQVRNRKKFRFPVLKRRKRENQRFLFKSKKQTHCIRNYVMHM